MTKLIVRPKRRRKRPLETRPRGDVERAVPRPKVPDFVIPLDIRGVDRITDFEVLPEIREDRVGAVSWRVMQSLSAFRIRLSSR